MRGARWLIDSLRDKLPFDKSLGQHFLVNDDLQGAKNAMEIMAAAGMFIRTTVQASATPTLSR